MGGRRYGPPARGGGSAGIRPLPPVETSGGLVRRRLQQQRPVTEVRPMRSDDPTYDVLIVGSGLMGAAVARLVRDQLPKARILMLDGGPRIGSTPGQHLHDVPERDIWERYNQRVSSGIQGLYTGTAPTGDVGSTLVDVEPGMYHLSSIGEDSREMPAAAVA